MDNPEQLGRHKSITIEQDEQGNIILGKRYITSTFALTAEEAVDILYWLYDRRDELHRLAYPAQENAKQTQQRRLPEWARKPKETLLQDERPEDTIELSKLEDIPPS